MSEWTPPGALPGEWRNNVIGVAQVDPTELEAPSINPWIHTRGQQKAIEGVLSKIGWWSCVIVNSRNGRIVDGSMRVQRAIANKQPTVPVLFVDLDEHEERAAIAYHNQIARMVVLDPEVLDDLIVDLSTSDVVMETPDLTGLLEQMAASVNLQPAPLKPGGPPAGDILPPVPARLLEQTPLFTGPAEEFPRPPLQERTMSEPTNVIKLPFGGGLGGVQRDRPKDELIQALMQAINPIIFEHGFGTAGLRIVEEQVGADWAPVAVEIKLIQFTDEELAQLKG